MGAAERSVAERAQHKGHLDPVLRFAAVTIFLRSGLGHSPSPSHIGILLRRPQASGLTIGQYSPGNSSLSAVTGVGSFLGALGGHPAHSPLVKGGRGSSYEHSERRRAGWAGCATRRREGVIVLHTCVSLVPSGADSL